MEEARSLNHNFVGTEHILLGLVREREGVAARVLANFGLGLERLRAEVMAILGQSPDARKETVRRWFDARKKPVEGNTVRCSAERCSKTATYRLTYAEHGRCVRQEHLCEAHAEDAVLAYKSHPGPGASTPAVLNGAKPFGIGLVVESDISDQQVIFLHEAGTERLVPIFTGAVEASAVQHKLAGGPVSLPWPSTHDAMAAIIRACGAEVQHANVYGLEQHDVYHAKLLIGRGDDLTDIEMRPTDAFLLALAFDRPIFLSDSVLDRLEKQAR
jgi:bifunctional DNase/RNase